MRCSECQIMIKKGTPQYLVSVVPFIEKRFCNGDLPVSFGKKETAVVCPKCLNKVVKKVTVLDPERRKRSLMSFVA